ncbi:hypothetical protein [Pilimelia columellifera]|uniref:Uncharacterized protein n=1 Tax=Pilimelia columellifera subsp. columellifera TaxID=706583 RepID=A0ABN3NS78_9ACTN
MSAPEATQHEQDEFMVSLFHLQVGKNTVDPAAVLARAGLDQRDGDQFAGWVTVPLMDEGYIEGRAAFGTNGCPMSVRLTEDGRKRARSLERMGPEMRRNKHQQFALAQALYRVDPFGERMHDPYDFARECGVDTDSLSDPHISTVTIPLMADGYITGPTVAEIDGPLKIKITPEGRRWVEGVSGPEEHTMSRSGGLTISGTGHNVAVQNQSPGATQHFTATTGGDIDKVLAWTRDVLDAINAADLDPETTKAIRDEVGDLEQDARQPNPDRGRLHRGIKRVLRDLPAGVAANLTASGAIAAGTELLALVRQPYFRV